MKVLYHKTLNFLSRHFTAIKVWFAILVFFFVIHVGSTVVSKVSGVKMRAAFATQTPTSLLILLILGLISVLPMLTYDFSMVDLLPGKFKPSYVVKSGWIVNTLTNIAGFGGILGSSLRAHFYSRGSSRKQIIAALAKVALFLLAGLSTYCLISLVMIWSLGMTGHFSRDWYDWLLLIGGGVYFPAIFIWTRCTNLKFFNDLTLKREAKLIVGSCCEWGGCAALFLIIGAFMHVNVNLVHVFPWFIMANVAGVVSLLPGGLGSFDGMMILELSAMGLSPSTAVVWLLLYRAFYYFIPVLIGIVLLAYGALKRLNQSLAGIPAIILQRTAQIVLTVFMYFSGFMMLLLALLPNYALVNKVYLSLEPYTFYFLDQLTNIIFAFIFIGLARGIGSRIKKAFWPTALVLLISMANSLWKEDFPVSMCITFAVILLCLWLSRNCLYRQKLSYSWGQKIIDAVILTITFAIYLVVGIYTRYQYAIVHLSNTYLFPSFRVWLVGLIGLVVDCLILVIIYRYLAHQPVSWLNQPFDEKRVRSVIQRYGGNEVSHLAFVRDKQIYFYRRHHQDQLFFMFRPEANKLIVMGEPVGNQRYVGPAVDQFMNAADKLGLSLVFYEVGQCFTMLLHEKGFDFIKFGEEGFVDLPNFNLVGSQHRGDRALIHKFERNHYHFLIVKPPFSPALMNRLRQISDSWLGGKPEKGFSLGYFEPFYLNQAPVALMKAPDGSIISFANVMPSGNSNVTSVDLMRSSQEAPSGIMDGLFITLFKHARKAGYQVFNLGMAPLSNVGKSKFSFVKEKVAHLIYEYGYKFYSFQGLRNYKNKFVSSWKSRYIVYRKKSSLIFTMLQLLLLVNERVDNRKKSFSLIRIFSKR